MSGRRGRLVRGKSWASGRVSPFFGEGCASPRGDASQARFRVRSLGAASCCGRVVAGFGVVGFIRGRGRGYYWGVFGKCVRGVRRVYEVGGACRFLDRVTRGVVNIFGKERFFFDVC